MLEKNAGKVKIVMKHFPLSMHKFAFKASAAALAADKQGKFHEFDKKLFENYASINDSKIQEIGKELKLDMNKLNADMNSKEIADLIKRDMNNGNDIGVRGTPAIFVNGRTFQDRSVEGFQKIIDEIIKKK